MFTRKLRRPTRTRKTQKVRIPISRSGILGKFGYKNIIKTPEKERRNALMRYIHSGSNRTQRIRTLIQKLNALAIVQKNRQPEFSRRVRRDQQFVSRILKSV